MYLVHSNQCGSLIGKVIRAETFAIEEGLIKFRDEEDVLIYVLNLECLISIELVKE